MVNVNVCQCEAPAAPASSHSPGPELNDGFHLDAYSKFPLPDVE